MSFSPIPCNDERHLQLCGSVSTGTRVFCVSILGSYLNFIQKLTLKYSIVAKSVTVVHNT